MGNKTSIVPIIEQLLQKKGLIAEKLTFFDAFCGTGSVADYFKQYYDVIINDNLNWAVSYSWGRICSSTCDFSKLGFDPFEYLNNNTNKRHGFIYNNYSLGKSKRMYFTEENAARIDYFRWQIEQWNSEGLLSENEYKYLIACLIESVSDVSNTAGVYGAFLKKWDARALKPIVFDKVDSNEFNCKNITAFSDKIENIIEDVNCDILYLDPPYTQNQYGTQYHL
ncbi:MAG: DNA adenine methylase, partial [Clostridia bacterium]|nr:DNA adenine methylase [Clostridia bacterium]